MSTDNGTNADASIPDLGRLTLNDQSSMNDQLTNNDDATEKTTIEKLLLQQKIIADLEAAIKQRDVELEAARKQMDMELDAARKQMDLEIQQMDVELKHIRMRSCIGELTSYYQKVRFNLDSNPRESGTSWVSSPPSASSSETSSSSTMSVEQASSGLPFLQRHSNAWVLPEDDSQYRDDNLCDSLQKFVIEHSDTLQKLGLEDSTAPKAKGKGRSLGEVQLTQPFMNGILELALPFAQSRVAGSNLKLYSGREALRNDGTAKQDLVRTKARGLSRHPDSAFFIHTAGNEDVKFDSFASSAGMVMSVEAKWKLDKTRFEAALQQCLRDFVTHSSRFPAHQMRVGHAAVTDGLDWYFVRMWWTCPDVRWERQIEISQKVDINDASTLSSWLIYSLMCAHQKEYRSTGWDIRMNEFSLVEVLGDSYRALTTRWKNDNDGEKGIVIKHWRTYKGDANCAYMEQEREYLTKFETSSWSIKMCTAAELSFNPSKEMTCLVDAGQSLASYDICGNHGKKLAKVVKSCI